MGASLTIEVEIDRTDCDWALTKDGKLISDPEDTGGNTSTYGIKALSESDAGDYQVTATVRGTTVSTKSTVMKLTVQ